jgi:RNA polymerase sigma-70 factor (ECF subfamily)
MQSTRLSLLQRAVAGGRDAWSEIDYLYRPFIQDWFRSQGVASEEVEDLTQEVLMTLFKELHAFQHPGKRGAFRSWMRSICVNRLLNYRRYRRIRGEAIGGTDFHARVQEIADEGKLSDIWDREHRQAILRYLFTKIEHQFEELTLSIFRRLTLDQWTVAQIAAEYSISPGKVYVARSRVLRRLRDAAEEILGEPLT